MIVPRHPLYNESPYQNQPALLEYRKTCGFYSVPAFLGHHEVLCICRYLYEKQRGLWEYKNIQSEGGKETVTFNSRTPLNLRYKGELSWS